MVWNSEFLREGSAVYDSSFPDRIVLEAERREALDTMRAQYEPIIEQTFSTELDPRPKTALPFVTKSHLIITTHAMQGICARSYSDLEVATNHHSQLFATHQKAPGNHL